MRLLTILLLLPLLSTNVVSAQNAASVIPDPENPIGENMDIPPGWEIRLDRPNPDFRLSADPDSADIWFVTMTPGWHITSGPAAIFYHPALSASGDYTATSTIHIIEPSTRNEGYGIFVGGSDLGGDGQAYTYFLVRNDGSYLIKKRTGADTETIVPWTKSDAINTAQPDTPQSSAANVFKVDVSNGLVVFFLNDEAVHELDSAGLSLNGKVGLRINHGLNVHVTDLATESD